MTNLRTGVILSKLRGERIAPSHFYGRKITAIALTEQSLVLGFADGTYLTLRDDGQSCCESRYMTTDDDPASLVGHTLLRIEGKPGTTSSDTEHDTEHETVFVEIATDGGFITIVNHNKHNGYYGGFALCIKEGL